jgi:TetR/AcrR family transcriptional regulator, ethionamide resistance regulator
VAVPTPSKRTQRAQRREDIRGRLLRVVEDRVAGGESYANVSIDQLATVAGISRATFYSYFADKGDLLRAWLAAALEELDAACNGWRAMPDRPSREDVHAAVVPILEKYRGLSALMSAVIAEATRDGSLRADVSRATAGARKALREHIERGQVTGVVDPRLLAPETAGWLMAMLERALMQTATASPKSLRAQAAALSDVVWHVLYANDER